MRLMQQIISNILFIVLLVASSGCQFSPNIDTSQDDSESHFDEPNNNLPGTPQAPVENQQDPITVPENTDETNQNEETQNPPPSPIVEEAPSLEEDDSEQPGQTTPPEELPPTSESTSPLVNYIDNIITPAEVDPAKTTVIHDIEQVKSQISPAIANTVYAHGPRILYSLHVGTHELRQIAYFKLEGSVTDIALDQDGYIFAITGNQLFVCDALDATCFLLGNTQGGSVGLSFLSPIATGLSGDILVAQSGSNWSQLVLNESGVSRIDYGAFDQGISIAGDVFSIDNVGTYAAVYQNGHPKIIEVDPLTGSTTRIVQDLHRSAAVWGVAGWTDKIYLFTSAGHILLVHPETGHLDNLGKMPFSFWGAGVMTQLLVF